VVGDHVAGFDIGANPRLAVGAVIVVEVARGDEERRLLDARLLEAGDQRDRSFVGGS
jgi:hypothetical protein